MDPKTGANTQKIECCKKEGKAWLHRVRIPSHLLQSHLDGIAWRLNNKNCEQRILVSYLRDVKKYFSNETPAQNSEEVQDQER